MKKKSRKGKLRTKILIMVLFFLLLLIGVFVSVLFFHSRILTGLVTNTSGKQQIAISKVSDNTMRAVIDSSITRQNELQAAIADNMFAELKSNILTMQSIAEGIFEDRDIITPGVITLPDPADDGIPKAQIIFEEGVDPYTAEYLPYAVIMNDTMVSMYENSATLSDCYIALEDGCLITVDENSANKYDKNGNLISFPTRERPWYIATKEAGELVFSGVVEDSLTGQYCITCTAPVYANGEFIGVVGADYYIDEMLEYTQDATSEGSFIAVINKNGEVIVAPDNNGVFTVETNNGNRNAWASYTSGLSEFIRKGLKEKTGVVVLNVGGKDYYMVASPMKTIGWTVISVVDKEYTEQPTKMMMQEYNEISNSSRGTYRDTVSKMVLVFLIVTVVVLIMAYITAKFVASRISRPIETMTNEIIEAGQNGKMFEMKDSYRTKDEIEVLAEAFDDLSRKTRQYIIDITNITAEKERIGTELEIAQKIQADMLPNIFPPFPERKEFDIFASMDPAKEVGGDFYDFFLIDENHLGLVMADVSGKGVPAALFMMMSKIVIKNFALQGLSPAEILRLTNDTICENNDEDMFVTVWMAILEISTGKITAANAGHEFPVIRTKDGDYEVFKDKHGLVIGAMEGMKYKDYEMQLEKGGAIFVYTDGVPEATSLENELYGMDRLITAMNENKGKSPKDLLPKIRSSIDEFVGEAEQFDDITMLCLVYNGPQEQI
ncbi:MAG: SpoIIE family protein phosphatase [Lachnospiraceae bacterium]|nr:SpoIIE family protein phosphatase [Lachnospiraceae bacterium]